jgi:hypothetical protein
LPENKVGYYTSINDDGYVMLSKQFRKMLSLSTSLFLYFYMYERENSGYLPYRSFMSLQNIFQQLNEYLSTIKDIDNSARGQITRAPRRSTTRLHQYLYFQ